jgi:hypothetical protein
MLTQEQLLNLRPPPGLSDEELQAWWEQQICEPDGTLIMNDEWAEHGTNPNPEPEN